MPKKIKKGKKAVKKVTKKVVKKVAKKVTKKVTKKVAKKVTKKACVTKKASLSVKKAFNKSQTAGAIADMTCLSKKDAGGMIDALCDIIAAHLKKRGGVGEFTLPGVAKFRVVNKPATKSRKGVNPFTGEPMVFAAKPARNIVKVRALKKLKDIAK